MSNISATGSVQQNTDNGYVAVDGAKDLCKRVRHIRRKILRSRPLESDHPSADPVLLAVSLGDNYPPPYRADAFIPAGAIYSIFRALVVALKRFEVFIFERDKQRFHASLQQATASNASKARPVSITMPQKAPRKALPSFSGFIEQTPRVRGQCRAGRFPASSAFVPASRVVFAGISRR